MSQMSMTMTMMMVGWFLIQFFSRVQSSRKRLSMEIIMMTHPRVKILHELSPIRMYTCKVPGTRYHVPTSVIAITSNYL